MRYGTYLYDIDDLIIYVWVIDICMYEIRCMINVI